MQGSLDRLFEGMADGLRDVVLPALDDPFARSQVTACIELLANLAPRVEWRMDQVQEVTAQANAAVDAAIVTAPELADALPMATDDDALVRRDVALRRVSAALGRHDLTDEAAAPLLEFCRWHLADELGLLRTGRGRR